MKFSRIRCKTVIYQWHRKMVAQYCGLIRVRSVNHWMSPQWSKVRALDLMPEVSGLDISGRVRNAYCQEVLYCDKAAVWFFLVFNDCLANVNCKKASNAYPTIACLLVLRSNSLHTRLSAIELLVSIYFVCKLKSSSLKLMNRLSV